MIAVFHRADGFSILGMVNLDAAIHVAEVNARSTIPNFTAQVVANKVMMIDVQSEIVVNPS